MSERTGIFSEDEDIKLKDVVQTHGTNNWLTIAALVQGRTQKQCYGRWKDVPDPSIDRVVGRTGTWAEDEDIMLKNAVQTHGGKNWDAITVLVPERTSNRWRCLRRSSRSE
jgi:myb proto-oncogene protein